MPDRNDKVMMSVGGKITPVDRSEFVSGFLNDNAREDDGSEPGTLQVPGAGGGGTISADTAIGYPGAFANWAALISSLKGSTYTGKVTVTIADGVYTEPFTFPNDFYMPNLHIVFGDGSGAGVQIDTTGWTPNFLGVYTVFFGGSNFRVGSISGTVTRSAGAEQVFAMTGYGAEIGFGTTLGVAGTETDMTFDGFSQGVSLIESHLVGNGGLIVTGVDAGTGGAINFYGGELRNIKLSTDSQIVTIGKNATIGYRGSIGGFQSIELTGNLGMQRAVSVAACMADLGRIIATTTDNLQVGATGGAQVAAAIPAGASYIGDGVFYADEGCVLDVIQEGALTWKPQATNSGLVTSLGKTNYTGNFSSVITVDNTLATPDFIFGQVDGAIGSLVTTAGNFGQRTKYPANRFHRNYAVQDYGAQPLQVSNAASGATVVVLPSTTTLSHDNGAATAALTLDMTALQYDGEEMTLLAAYDITTLTISGDVSFTASVTADTPVKLVRINGNWYAI